MRFLVAVFVKFFYHKEKDFPLQNRLPCWLPWRILEKICYFSNVNYLKLNVLEKKILVAIFFLKKIVIIIIIKAMVAFIPEWVLAECPVHAFISRKYGHSLWFLRNVCILTSFAESNSIKRPRTFHWSNFDFCQLIPRRGSYCVVLYSDRVCHLSTQVEETFTRMKVAWTKNKREFKRLHFPLFCFRRVASICDGGYSQIMADAVWFRPDVAD